MTTPVTTQGPAMQGMPSQQGYMPGFPAPLGIEQYLGQQQPYGGSTQQSYMQPQFPGTQLPGQQNQIHQIVQPLVSQLLPIAQQVILPQVVATAVQQIQVYLHQFVTQQLNSQFGQQGWQQPQFGQQGWQQPFTQQGHSQYGRFQQGSY